MADSDRSEHLLKDEGSDLGSNLQHQQAAESGEKPLPAHEKTDEEKTESMEPSKKPSGPLVETPPPPSPPCPSSTGKTSIEKFLACNPKLDLIKEQRDVAIGWLKFVNAAIFGFLLFSPALGVIPQMEAKWIVGVLWTMICLILWSYLEYQARSQLWFICLCRGVIIDFHKTDTALKWICQKPMFFSYSFIGIFVVVTYIGLDPHFKFDDVENFQTAGLQAVALLFVIFMSKSIVDLEGSNWLLTPNLMCYYFQDPEMLEAKGFKLVHVSNLKKLVGGISLGELGSIATAGLLPGAAEKKPFSWNDVHALSSVPDASMSFSLVDGYRIARQLHDVKDLDT